MTVKPAYDSMRRSPPAGALLATALLIGWLAAAWSVAQVVDTQPATEAEQPAAPVGPFDRAVVIPIHDEITEITFDSIKRRFDYVRSKGIPLVILDLDTPGGALGPTLDICDAIKRARREGIAIYAWVNNEAYSAGTIIALATDGIVMAPNATMGDCQPIMLTGSGASAIPEDIEAKTTSPLIEELRDSARRNGYDLDMVMALIRPEMQIFWVVNTDTSEKDFVDAQGRNERFGWNDGDLKRGGLLGLFGDGDSKSSGSKEPLPNRRSNTAWHYVKEDPALGQIDQPIVSSRDLLTMRDQRALAFGFSRATLDNEEEVRDYFSIGSPLETLKLTWTEEAVEWLASPMVRGVLFVLMLLGAYAEFHTPGFGIAGAVALVALVLFLGAPYMAGFTVTWEIVVIVLGMGLLLIEAFIIPGFGVAGFIGIALLLVGLLSSFVPKEPFHREWFELPSLPMTYDYFKRGVYTLAGGMIGSVVAMYLVAKYLPKAPIASRIIGRNPTPADVTVPDAFGGAAQVGDIGRTESLLRPAGKARFGATLVDVVSEAEYIDHGMLVEVIERRGNRVVVRRAPE